MYTLNDIALSTYGITAGHAPSSNVSMQGVFDMPKRTGTTFKDWDDSDSVEPWVLANEIFFAGRDIVFNGSIQGTTSGMNGYLESFYAAINAASGLSILTTPYNSASGYVKSVTPEYMNGGCSVEITFREPVVSLVGSLPASGSSANMIDSIPFLSFGLYLSKAKALHDLPDVKQQHFTKYGEEGYQIVKRKTKNLDLKGFIIGNSLVDFTTKVQALYKAFSSAGERSIVIDTNTTVTCFAVDGFNVNNITLHSGGVIGNFNSSLIATDVVYSYYPSALANRHFWFDPSDSTTITGFDAVATRVNDKLGNGNDMTVGSGTSVDNTLLFNGTSQYLKTGAIAAMTQPTMIYMIVKQVTWSTGYFFDGYADGERGIIAGVNPTPNIKGYAGTWGLGNSNLVVDTWGILRIYFNGASSKLQVNETVATTWDAGILDMGGITLAARFGATHFSNIQVKDVIAMPSDEAETEIYNWLVTRL